MKKLVTLLLSITMIAVIVVSAAILVPLFMELRESHKVQIYIQEEEAEKVDFYEKVEQICLKYASGENEVLNEKFNLFLAENSISPESILNYVERLQTYNSDRRTELIKSEEDLKNSLPQEEFEAKREILLKEYINSLNTIEDYLSSTQKETFENSKEIIEELFLMI